MTPDTNAHRGSRAPLYTVPTNPGGSKWERNTPPPIGVCYRHSRQSFGVAVRCLTDYLRAGSPRESRPLSSGSRGGALLTRSLARSATRPRPPHSAHIHTYTLARMLARTPPRIHPVVFYLTQHTLLQTSLWLAALSLPESFIRSSTSVIGASPRVQMPMQSSNYVWKEHLIECAFLLVWFGLQFDY